MEIKTMIKELNECRLKLEIFVCQLKLEQYQKELNSLIIEKLYEVV